MANEILEFNNLSEEERKVALKILEQYGDTGNSTLFDNLTYEDFEEIPVDIITFLTDNEYLGYAWHDGEGKCKLYPRWEKFLTDLFPNNLETSVNTAIESGARGIGKSEIAVATAAYMMYRLMCLKNPLEYFRMKPTEKFCFAFINIKLSLAEEIANSKFQNTVKMSPWFLRHGTMSGMKYKKWTPPEYIEIIIGSQADDLIGKPILFAFFDEISFIRNQDIDKQKAKAIDMIDTAIGGMKTRFTYKGKNPSLLMLGSSKRSEKSFLETHMKKKLETEKENVLIIDEPVWNVKPPETYCGERFNVALGNKFLVSKVIDADENVNDYESRGYTILSVPVEFRANFLEDMDRALCDYAGISSSEISKYISGAIFSEVLSDAITNPFVKDIIEVGNSPEDKQQYCDFFDISKVPREYIGLPLFIHLDMSVSGDKTGIFGTWIKGKKQSVDSVSQANDLFYRAAFGVSVKAPKGMQISFEKNKNFIYWLSEQGFNIRGISSDSFQSVETGQTLIAKGYNYKMISVDRVDTDTHICRPYQYYKTAIYEKRYECFKSKLLTNEVTELERNINTGKVDHPEKGSKDMADAACGSMYHASQYAEEFAYDYGESIELSLGVSESKGNLTVEQINEEFEKALAETNDPMERFRTNINKDNSKNNTNSKPANFGFGVAQNVQPMFGGDGIFVW